MAFNFELFEQDAYQEVFLALLFVMAKAPARAQIEILLNFLVSHRIALSEHCVSHTDHH